MSKMIQVRNVPDRLHRELMRRAKAEGKPLTAYVEEILEREVRRPPAREVLDRIRARISVPTERPVADLIREDRAARDDR